MKPKRESIQPTYDSRETGDPYHVTSKVDGHVITWRERVPDPFVRTTVTVALRDLLCGLLRGHLTVEVLVSGDPEVVDAVLELDANTLIGGSSRRDEFNRGIHAALGSIGAFDDLPTTEEQQ